MSTGATGQVDFIMDIASKAFGYGTEDYNTFVYGGNGLPGMEEIIKPNCPITLNILYGFLLASSTKENPILQNTINSISVDFKYSLIATSLTAFIIVFIAILYISVSHDILSVQATVFTVIFVIFFLFAASWIFLNFAGSDIQGIGGSIVSSVETIFESFPVYLEFSSELSETMKQVRLQQSTAVC